MKKLYLVDVSSMFFRAFYAIRPLSNPAGMPVNALYGFISMTVKLLREIRPDYMVFAFDRSGTTFRNEIDPNYKANRSEMPADLVPQIPYFRRVSEALSIPCIDAEGFEADDIIGTLTHLGRDAGVEVVIVSSDKDFAQLIKPFVSMYDTMKEVRYDEAAALEKWGVEPRKMRDYLALVGDASDNVPGVAGIGAKGAAKLLQEFDSLEDIYANLDKVSGTSLKKKLEAGRDDANLSKRLVTIVCDMKLGVEIEDLRLKPIHREALHDLLLELDFKSFARTLLGDYKPGAPATEDAPIEDPGHSVAHVLNPAGNENNVIKGTAGAYVRPAPETPAVEVGATRIDVSAVKEDRLDLAGLAKWIKPGAETWTMTTERATYLAHQDRGAWSIAECAVEGAELGRLLTESKLRFKGFGLKDFCKRNLITTPLIEWDQMLAAYVIRAGPIERPEALFTLYNGESLPDLPSAPQLLSAHLVLETQLRRKLASVDGEKVLFEIEQPLVPILLAMENSGILIDRDGLKIQSESLGRDIRTLEAEIHEAAGGPFNIGSPKQLGQILFEKMKMPAGKKNKTGYSTDNEVLEKLSAEFPITAKVLQWRELSKLRSTYVDALPLLADAEGRVHTTYNQALTTTGRLSSTNPNLQNIPIRTERGNQIRKCFVAAPGRKLVSVDYSQIELRILAHITGDPGLVRAFEAGHDIHAATASEVFDVPLTEVTSDMRRKAKAVNFGLAYGQGAFGLAETLRISRGEATEIINRYFARFSGVKTFMTETVEEAQKKGYVETVFGRRRYLDELYSKSPAVKKFGERAAINAPIQGTASDLVKMAMIKVGLPSYGTPMLQVHDELVLEVDDQKVDEACRETTERMEGVVSLRVPLKVNTGVGKNWEQAH